MSALKELDEEYNLPVSFTDLEKEGYVLVTKRFANQANKLQQRIRRHFYRHGDFNIMNRELNVVKKDDQFRIHVRAVEERLNQAKNIWQRLLTVLEVHGCVFRHDTKVKESSITFYIFVSVSHDGTEQIERLLEDKSW